MPERTCPVCSSTFKPTWWNQIYCPPTPEDKARVNGSTQARSKCAKRGANHALRTRQGKATKALTSPLASPFDCEQCRTPCVPGQDDVAAHATRFCGYDCKMQWHSTHEDGAMTRWAREVGPAYVQARAHATAVKRLLTCPPRVTASDGVTYRRALRADPCAYCGAPSEASDHIVPKADGGSDDWDNRTGACHRCNNLKQSTPLLVFLAYKQTREAFEPWRAIVAAIHTRRKQ